MYDQTGAPPGQAPPGGGGFPGGGHGFPGGPGGDGSYTFQFGGGGDNMFGSRPGGGGGGFSDPFKIFESFFGGMGGGGGGGGGGMPGMGGGGFQFGGPGGGGGMPRHGGQQVPPPKLYTSPLVTHLTKANFKATVGKEARGAAVWIVQVRPCPKQGGLRWRVDNLRCLSGRQHAGCSLFCVQFYNPADQACQAVASVFESVAELLEGVVSFGVVDCGREASICRGYVPDPDGVALCVALMPFRPLTRRVVSHCAAPWLPIGLT